MPTTERSWWDLTKDEGLAFARKVVKEDVTGWDELKAAARDFGFEPDEAMPTVFELKRMIEVQSGSIYRRSRPIF